MDWTGGWTDTKNHFIRFLTRLTRLWSCVELCSLLCSYTVVLTRPSVLVKVYPACNGFPIPLCYSAKQPDFSERGHHYLKVNGGLLTKVNRRNWEAE